MMARQEHHDGTLSHDNDPRTNQLIHPLYDRIRLEVLRNLVDWILNSSIITQQESPPL